MRSFIRLSCPGSGAGPALALALLALALAPLHAAGDAVPVLRIDAGVVTARVSPLLYGLMTEEINHSYDGGLYAELVSNRIFRDDPQSPAHWSLVLHNGGSASMSLDEGNPINALLTTTLRLDVNAASEGQLVGVANDGFWGVPIRPATHYHVSFYAKTGGDFGGLLTVALESADGSKTYASVKMPKVGGDWKNYSAELTTGHEAPTAGGRLAIYAAHSGTLWLDLVSCFPPTWNDRPNGNRIDLMRKLDDLHPSFLRFPGGNYLEGDTIATRFNWKATIHGLDRRLGHQQPWGYRSSDGMGLLEFLEWCEDLRMQPVLAVFAGYSLNHDHIPPGPKLQHFVQDALDEIEYVTGDATTRWGAERSADGHPAPFPLTYVEVGNEDNPEKWGGYDGRFTQFYDAIRAKYPGLRIIATARVKSRTPDVYDEHFYYSAARIESETHRYDGYGRSGPKIFVGEWATIEGSPTPDLHSALGDAAWMTGLERNSDLVIMASYAPLLVNVNPGAWQWRTNLIGYNGLISYGSPSYHAQVMFSRHRGDVVLRSSFDGAAGFFHSATRDTRSGVIYLKAVNATGTPQCVKVEITGVPSVGPGGGELLLTSAKPTDTNSIDEPAKVIPVASKLQGIGASFMRRFAPYSVTVLELPAR